MNKTFLRTLDPVKQRFKGASIENPVQDAINRGVDPRAIDDFIEECLMVGINTGLSPMRSLQMVACSAFHMGMLTQHYLNETKRNASTRQVLEEIQWNGYAYIGIATCPSCGREREQGHSDVCPIGRLLEELPPEIERNTP